MSNAISKLQYFRVLSIAGSDSGGGAGIQADLKTFAALGCYGMTAITALTSQNTLGVRSIHSVPPEMLRDQIDVVADDIGVQAVKIGMLHSLECVQIVASAIDRHQLENIVLDPVMVATSGAVLIEKSAISILVEKLFSRAALVTPNLDEAALLVGRAITTEKAMEFAAQELLNKGAKAVLIKGGHLSGNVVSDLFATQSGQLHWMRAPRIHSINTHGTGCTLSSAIAAHLAMGASLLEAVQAGHSFVREAIEAGLGVCTGAGGGPLNHGHKPVPMHFQQMLG